MSRPIVAGNFAKLFEVECQKEKCGSWGVVGDEFDGSGSGRTYNRFGCKRDKKGN